MTQLKAGDRVKYTGENAVCRRPDTTVKHILIANSIGIVVNTPAQDLISLDDVPTLVDVQFEDGETVRMWEASLERIEK